MNEYIATFYTHYAAMRSHQSLMAAGVPARLAPVPRKLSASCGTCVLYSSEAPREDCMHADLERIVRVGADGAYSEIVSRS